MECLMQKRRKPGGRQHRATSRRHAVEMKVEAGGVVVAPSSSGTASKNRKMRADHAAAATTHFGVR